MVIPTSDNQGSSFTLRWVCHAARDVSVRLEDQSQKTLRSSSPCTRLEHSPSMIVEVALIWSSVAATTEIEFDIEPRRVSADCHQRRSEYYEHFSRFTPQQLLEQAFTSMQGKYDP